MHPSRRPLIGGNWKMHGDGAASIALACGIEDHAGPAELIVFPSMPYLATVADELAESAVAVGGQDVSDQPEGACTGQTAAAMLLDCGCTWTLVGHSERRHGMGETSELCSAKVRAGLAGGLNVMLCVGETLQEREAGHARDVVREQLEGSLAGVETGDLARMAVAYEPVWAIGTGLTATPEDAQDMHQDLREMLAGRYDAPSATGLRILYGGSVKPANAADLLACPDIDGALVGGASLEPESFLAIAKAADTWTASS
ncbi:MAG: triose-phosphate isomerase [Phycisphaerales bacterium]|nr:triose-phosphate isomerase [Phycisphaerales bacterium]